MGAHRWVLGVLWAALACSEVAGLGDERTPGPDAANPDAPGAGGSAGAAGDAGSGGVGAGTGGSAGTAGADGGAGDAGSETCDGGVLGDNQNCGSCGHDCLGGACQSGECQPVELVTTPHGGWDIAAGADAVFWTNQMDGNFFRMEKTGSSPQSWPGQGGPKEVASVGSFVFIASPGKDAVLRAPADGSAAPSTYFSAPQAIETLAADASGVYFDGPSAIYVTDGSQQTLVEGAIAQPMLIAVDATHVYFTTLEAGDVYRAPKSGGGGPLLPIASAGTKTRALALDAQWLYFATWDSANPVISSVYRIAKDGSGSQQAIGGGAGAIKMVRAGPYLYWANQGTQPAFSDGTIQRARVDGATPEPAETVAASQNRPRSIAADDPGKSPQGGEVAVYWLNCGWPYPTQGSVWRHAL
jgi:hypothetical protein